MRADTAIAGIGLAGIGEAFGFSEIEILAMAAKSAADDAGLNLKESSAHGHGKSLYLSAADGEPL